MANRLFVNQTDLRRFVKAVGDGLQLMLPAGFEIREAGGQLAVTTQLGTDFLLLGENINANLEEGSAETDAISIATLNIMNELQDIVTRSSTVPWPQDHTTRRHEFAPPHAEIRGRTLYLWFGTEEEHPVTPRIRVPLP